MKTAYPVFLAILLASLNALVAQTQGIDDPANILPVIYNDFRDDRNRKRSAADFSCPDCSENAAVLKDITFPSGSECQCIGHESITIGPGVTIQGNAKVTFRAPRVKIQSGFHVERNATVHIKQGGRIYYVSTQGSDQSDGLTQGTAFATLGHAIEVVKPGESVHILGGTYNEALMLENIGGEGGIITIRGIGSKPVFDGKRTGAIGFWCEKCKNLLFDNLEFTNYTDIGIGVYLSSGITMKNLKIHKNGFKSQLKGWEVEGYGIHIDICQTVTIKDNEVFQNGPDPKPKGVLGTGINTFECTDCVIRDNDSYKNNGGGILVEDGVNVLVEGNQVRENDLIPLEDPGDEWWDGGIWVDGGHDIVLRNNLFQENKGPGIEISDEDSQNPYGYVLENNVSRDNYYGIFIWNLSKDDTWPDESILSRSGNQFIQNSIKNVWIVESY